MSVLVIAYRRFCLLVTALIATACMDRPVGTTTSDLGTLELQIVGLPSNVLPIITVSGVGGTFDMTGSSTLQLAAGPYLVSVPQSVTGGGATWYPNWSSLSLEVPAGSLRRAVLRFGPVPVSGAYVPGLELFDSVMVAYMTDRSIGAGTLAISRLGEVIYRRAFGWRDSARTQQLSPDAIMRLASNSKPITSAAVRKLVADGKLSLGTKAFAYLGITPAGHVADARVHDITVQHLLDHTGGWNHTGGNDIMFRARQISAQLGITTPPTRTQFAQVAMTQTLQFTPGAATSYSNFGYVLLGLIVEKASGQNFIDYVRQSFFSGAPTDIIQGRSLRADRDPREPFYWDPFKGCSVFSVSTCVLVPWPDGGWHLEALEGGGGLVASAPAMAGFLNAYWINGQPRAIGTAGSFTFFGSLDGTFTLTRQRLDGTNLVALFNQRFDPSGLSYEAIEDELDVVASRVFGASLSRVPPFSAPSAP